MSALQVYIGGTEVFGVQVDRSRGGGLAMSAEAFMRWTANFSIFKNDGVFCPALGQSVTIKEDGTVLFTGCVAELRWDRLEGWAHALTFYITCTDKSARLDQRIVTATSFSADQDAHDAILKIVQLYLDG